MMPGAEFQSTHPSRGATYTTLRPIRMDGFQSTHPSRGATRWTDPRSAPFDISIHAPLAGCDRAPDKARYGVIYFNPRTPRGVRRLIRISCNDSIHFNPRTPRGVRRRAERRAHGDLQFQSTHPSRGATDLLVPRPLPNLFQSTHPSRGATRLRLELLRGLAHFNPRTPRGVRRTTVSVAAPQWQFQSTHPSRGATGIQPVPNPHEFQSTHPSRGATENPPCSGSFTLFQSTHPSRGATTRMQSETQD